MIQSTDLKFDTMFIIKALASARGSENKKKKKEAQKIKKKKLKCNFYFEAFEYSLMSKLTMLFGTNLLASTMQESKIY